MQSGENIHLERLRRLDCCTVSDALDKLALSGVVTGIPQRSGSGRVAGIAITVKLATPAGPEAAAPSRHLGTTAIEAGGPDHVIVIEQHTGIEAGCWGGLLTRGARARGIGAVEADGPVRDIDEARECDFPIFAASVTALTARGRIVEQGTNVPILIREHKVNPGDYVLADNSAVVFVAAGDIERVLQEAEAIAAREAAMTRAIEAGTPIGEVLDGNYENMLKD
jgi:regulator of RNase E activity RraA